MGAADLRWSRLKVALLKAARGLASGGQEGGCCPHPSCPLLSSLQFSGPQSLYLCSPVQEVCLHLTDTDIITEQGKGPHPRL